MVLVFHSIDVGWYEYGELMNCGSLSLTSTTVMLTSVELDNDGRPLSSTVNVVVCTKPVNVSQLIGI